jgi:hypothetical protein
MAKVETICFHCGKIFLKHSCYLLEKNYCSRNCANKKGRHPIVEDKIVRLPLSNGMFAIIDRSDWENFNEFPELQERTWSHFKSPNRNETHYAVFHHKKKNKTIYLHSVLMKSQEGEMVDHKDFNGLNCRRENMRLCKSINNTQHRRKSSKRKYHSKYKGISYNETAFPSRPWTATIYDNKVKIHLGYFCSEEEAACAYNEAAIHFHGEFAVLNVIED